KTEKTNREEDKEATLFPRRHGVDGPQRDLYDGRALDSTTPNPPFRFIKEVKEGGMPKFDVEDANGVKWRVKLGEEAQAETAASRLVWAAGYNAEESYYFNRANIDG